MIDVGELKVGDRVRDRNFKLGTVAEVIYERRIDDEIEYVTINFDNGSCGVTIPTKDFEKVSKLNEKILKEKDKMIEIGKSYCFGSKADYIDFLKTVEQETNIIWCAGQKPTHPECIEYYKENIRININSYGITQGFAHGNEIKWISKKQQKGEKKVKEKFEGKYEVIINDPAVILFVNEYDPCKRQRKYVSKAHNEEFDSEKGLMCCLMKSFGISHLDLKRMLKNAKVQKKSEIKTVVLEADNKPESWKEEPKKQYDANEGLPEVHSYKRAVSPVGKHRGKPYTFEIGDTIVVRDCYTYKHQKNEDVINLLNKELTVTGVYADDFSNFYTVEYNGEHYFFVGSELEPVWVD